MNKPFGNADPKLSEYVTRTYAPEDPVLAEIRARSATAGLPDIQVAALDALHLEVLARAAGARRAVEVGTLGGYSGVALLRGMGPDGQLDTIEMSPHHADVARESFRRAGVGDARPHPRGRGRRRAADARRRAGRSISCSSTPTRKAIPATSPGRPTTCARAASCCSTTPSCSATCPNGHRRSRHGDPRHAVRPRGARARRKVSRDRPAHRRRPGLRRGV